MSCSNIDFTTNAILLSLNGTRLIPEQSSKPRTTKSNKQARLDHLLVASSIAGNEEHGHAPKSPNVLGEVDLLPALVVQEQSIPIRGDVPGRGGDGDVGRVHVGHDAAIGHRAQQAAERCNRDPGGEKQDGPNPAAAPEPAAAAAHGVREARTSRSEIELR